MRMNFRPSTGSKSTPLATATPVSRKSSMQKARLSSVRWATLA